MRKSDSFYKENILDRSGELLVMLTELEGANLSKRSGGSLLSHSDMNIGRSETGVYYISDIHLDHKIYKKFGKHGSLPKITKYIGEIVDELLKDDDENELFYPIQSAILILGDTSHSLAINKLFYEALSPRLPYHRDVFVTLGNHELWEYNSVDEALLAYGKLFDGLPNIHLLHNSLYANNLYKEPDELIELRRQRWQVFKDETLSEGAKAKAIKEIDIADPQYSLSEEERHKARVKASIISQDALQNMTVNEIRNRCFDSKLIIFGAIGYSQYDEKYNANVGMYMNVITTRDREGQLSKETELIHKKLVESLPNNHLLIATHMPLRCWSKAQPHEGWVYFSGHTHINQKILTDGNGMSFADNQVGYYGKRIKFNLAITEGRLDYFAYYKDGIYDIEEKDYSNFYRNTSKVMRGVDKRGGKKTKIKMLKNSGIYMFMLETEDRKLYLLEGGKRHKLRIQDIDYYYDNLVLLNKVVSEAVSSIREYLRQLSLFIRRIGGSGYVHGNIVDIDFYNHVMVDIRDGSVLPYFAYSIADRYEYPDLPKLLQDTRKDLYKNFLEYGGDLPVISTENQISTTVNHSADTTIYKDSNTMLKIQDMLDYNVIRFWNDELIEAIGNERRVERGQCPTAANGMLTTEQQA